MQKAKLKIGQVASIERAQAPNGMANELGRDEDFIYYDARPSLIGEIVQIDTFTESTGVYEVSMGTYRFTCGEESLEMLSNLQFNDITKAKGGKNLRKSTTTKAKKKPTINFMQEGSREEQIKECPRCEGDTTYKNFEIPGFTGQCCTECMLIKEYKAV